MKKSLLLLALLATFAGVHTAFAQVSESPELATKIKNEGLNNSKIEEIAQYMTDLLGSRLTASQQKRRADNLVIDKLKQFGLSNPRSAFAADCVSTTTATACDAATAAVISAATATTTTSACVPAACISATAYVPATGTDAVTAACTTGVYECAVSGYGGYEYET